MIEGNRRLKDDDPVELESQFILRLPSTPSASLRAAVRSGVSNLEDRLSIELESDMRHATVQFDKWTLPAKVYDLPTIVDSCKTLDKKIFYKTGDICQIMICKEEGSPHSDEDVSKKKEKDAKEKRFQVPHGLTPPLKNVRKRRFRKTLKKKCVDFPDVEKEVKRLLKTDNEAVNVRYEIVSIEDEKNERKMEQKEVDDEAVKKEITDSQAVDVGEYDLFGDVLSCSDDSDEEEDINVVDVDTKQARKLCNIPEFQEKQEADNEIIELSKIIHQNSEQLQNQELVNGMENIDMSQLESETAGENLGQMLQEQKNEEEKMALMEKLDELEYAISGLQAKWRAQELEMMSIENQALKTRFQSNIDSLHQEEYQKQMEYNEILNTLHN